MKAIELITILLLFCVSCVLAIFLLGLLGRVVAQAHYENLQTEQRETVLQSFMQPDPLVAHVTGESPYVDDGLTYFVPRPDEVR